MVSTDLFVWNAFRVNMERNAKVIVQILVKTTYVRNNLGTAMNVLKILTECCVISVNMAFMAQIVN
jgi:hypothetical protein